MVSAIKQILLELMALDPLSFLSGLSIYVDITMMFRILWINIHISTISCVF